MTTLSNFINDYVKIAAMTKTTARPVRYSIDVARGTIEPAAQCESSNQDERPAGCTPELIVLHGISLPPGQFGGTEVIDLFCNRLDWNAHAYFRQIRGLEVSAHLLIRRDGSLTQFVPFHRRAWHAGESLFRGRCRCNDFSIGIELEGLDDVPYSEQQYLHIVPVVAAICRAYPAISARTIAGHCDIAPGRKTDPGPAFDWLRLYDGLAQARETL